MCTFVYANTIYPEGCSPQFKYGYKFKFTHVFYGVCQGRIEDIRCDEVMYENEISYSVFFTCNNKVRATEWIKEDTLIAIKQTD
jgi:hypothetical protein